jgi:hypothetical protein
MMRPYLRSLIRVFHLFRLVIFRDKKFGCINNSDIFWFIIYLAVVSEIIRDRTDLKVKTPNYPGNYPGNSTTVWRFQHGHGIWSVYIQQFNLQNTPSCQADYLEITDLRTRSVGINHYE